MQKLSRKKLGLLVLLSILICGVAYGVLKYQEKITNTANIIGYDVKLFRTDTSAIVTAIPYGDIEQGLNKSSDQAFAFTKKLVMKNAGDFDCYLGWKLNTTLPNGVTLTCQYFWENSEWKPLPQNTFSDTNSWGLVAKNTLSQPVMWTLNVPNDAPRGLISFDILLLTATTSSG